MNYHTDLGMLACMYICTYIRASSGGGSGDESARYDRRPEPHQSTDHSGRPAGVAGARHLLPLVGQGAL